MSDPRKLNSPVEVDMLNRVTHVSPEHHHNSQATSSRAVTTSAAAPSSFIFFLTETTFSCQDWPRSSNKCQRERQRLNEELLATDHTGPLDVGTLDEMAEKTALPTPNPPGSS